MFLPDLSTSLDRGTVKKWRNSSTHRRIVLEGNMAQLVRNVIGESQSGYVKEKALQQWLKQAWPNTDIPVQVCIPRL